MGIRRLEVDEEGKMPIYEYQCEACGEQFQRIYMSPSERPEEIQCPECGSPEVRRLFSPPSVVAGSSDVDQEAEEAAGKPQLYGRKELDSALKQE